MADKPKPKLPNRKPSPHHRIVYSNQVGTTTSREEVRLRFGVIENSDETGMDVEDQVDVIINPIMVFKLRDLLSRLIKDHFANIEEAATKLAADANRKANEQEAK